MFTSARTRTRTLITVGTIVVLFTFLMGALQFAVPEITDPAWIRAKIETYGPLAPVVFILVQAGQVVLAPLPGQLLTFVGGYLFGTGYGAAFSLVGAAIGSAVAFLLARRYGRPYVERVITPETMAAFDEVVARDGRFALFLVFLVPGLPDDAICFMAGVTRLPLWQLVVISSAGRVPGYLLMSYAGAQLGRANYLEMTAILVTIALVSGVVYWQKDRILATLRR